MDVPEMVLTGVAASIALASNILHPLNTGWSGGILFDDQIRSALRLSSVDAQLEVRTGTDLGLAVMTSYPFLIDSLIVAYWYRGSADVALQMALIDAEAFGITGAIEGTTNFLSGRARPYSSECGSGIPSNTTDCATDTLNRSFFSGHTVASFTAAALICAHHEELRLFDNAGDHAACIAGFTASYCDWRLRASSATAIMVRGPCRGSTPEQHGDHPPAPSPPAPRALRLQNRLLLQWRHGAVASMPERPAGRLSDNGDSGA